MIFSASSWLTCFVILFFVSDSNITIFLNVRFRISQVIIKKIKTIWHIASDKFLVHSTLRIDLDWKPVYFSVWSTQVQGPITWDWQPQGQGHIYIKSWGKNNLLQLWDTINFLSYTSVKFLDWRWPTLDQGYQIWPEIRPDWQQTWAKMCQNLVFKAATRQWQNPRNFIYTVKNFVTQKIKKI